MVEDGVLMTGGAELERAALVLSFADRGFGERNLANTFLSQDSWFNEESLGWFDIVDEMEVETNGDEACCLPCGFRTTSKQKSCVSSPTHTVYVHSMILINEVNEHPNANRPRPALSPPVL